MANGSRRRFTPRGRPVGRSRPGGSPRFAPTFVVFTGLEETATSPARTRGQSFDGRQNGGLPPVMTLVSSLTSCATDTAPARRSFPRREPCVAGSLRRAGATVGNRLGRVRAVSPSRAGSASPGSTSCCPTPSSRTSSTYTCRPPIPIHSPGDLFGERRSCHPYDPAAWTGPNAMT